MAPPTDTAQAGRQAGDECARKCALMDHLAFIPIFTGEDPALSFADFLDKIQDMASYLAWTDEDKFFVARNRVAGRAAQLIKICSENVVDYQTFKEVMHERYARDREPGTVLQEFLSLQQGSETVTEFIARAKSMSLGVVKAQGLQGEAAEQSRLILLRSMLLSNLRPEIRRGVISKNPTSVEEILTFAKLEEKAFLSIRSSPGPRVSSPMEVCAVQAADRSRCEEARQVTLEQGRAPDSQTDRSIWCDRVDERFALIERRLDQLSITHQTRHRETVCYFCNRPGHISRHCLYRRQAPRETRDSAAEMQGSWADQPRCQAFRASVPHYGQHNSYLSNDARNHSPGEHRFAGSQLARGSYRARGFPRSTRR